MYKIKYSTFIRKWVVTNNETGLAHSSWKSVLDARKVASDLNKWSN